MRAASACSARNTTFPLWIYVRTSAHPAASKIARSSAISSFFVPPTLMARNSATQIPLAPDSAPMSPTSAIIRGDQHIARALCLGA